MKKFIILLCSICFITVIALSASAVQAASYGYKVNIDGPSAVAKNSTVEYVFSITDITASGGLLGADIYLQYDSSILECKGVAETALPASSWKFGSILNHNMIEVHILDEELAAAGKKDNCITFTVTFKAKSTAKTELSFTELIGVDWNVDEITGYGQKFTINNSSTSKIAVTGVSLNKTAISLTAGNTANLTATISPLNATNQNVTWSTSKSSVATVDQNGKVTAVKAGTATITVTTSDGSKKATCKVTVNCAHSSKTSVAAKASTCSTKGWDAYKKCSCGQLFNASGTSKISSVPYRDLAEHTWSANYSKDANYHWIACTVCDKVSAKAAHDWDGGKVTKEPTVKAAGVRTYTCETCSRTKTEEIPKLSTTWILGDVNCDGEVNARDARYVLRAAVGYTDKDVVVKYGDVNSDGEVNARDARYILRYAVGYKDGLGIGSTRRNGS